MAISIDTQDLLNYPGTTKRVSIDQSSIVMQGSEGDESFVHLFKTSAYSDIAAKTAIQDYYITDFKLGWCKSSGLVGTTFSLDTDDCNLAVKIDATVSGTSGDGYYNITLDHDNGAVLSGEVVAADMEIKIRALAANLEVADTGFRLAYMNTSVEFSGGKFWVLSGTAGKYFSGTNRSSVDIKAADSNDASVTLGFNLKQSSEVLDSREVREALVTTNVTVSGADTLTVNSNMGPVENDCMLITDGTNSDYIQVSSVSGLDIGFDADLLTHAYTANETKVQLLREADPDATPTLWLNTIDSICKHGVKTLVNQIDYSS